MEEKRLALAVARVLDLPEEERVVSAPVRADDAGDEVRERTLDERRLVDELEAWLVVLLAGTAREVVGKRRLPGLEHAHAEPHPLVQERAHARPAVDRDEHERRPERHGHEGVRRHAVHLVAGTAS